MSESSQEADEASNELIDVLRAFSTRIGRMWRDPDGLLDLVDDRLFEIESSLDRIGERSRRELLSVPEFIRNDVGHLPLFEAASLSHAAVHLAGEHWGAAVPSDARYLFAGLATRAIKTAREIAVLLEHGYSLAAKSRWRTLTEILVVTRVIAMGDRFTASRYKEHRWIMLANQRRKSGQVEWSGDTPSPETMTLRLTRRFGSQYVQEYGWAARVTAKRLGVASPRWSHLQQLANVGENDSRVRDAHHAVHGQDALGLLGTIDLGSGHFHAGASTNGVLEVERDSVRLLRQALSATFSICARYGDSRKPIIVGGIVEAHLFNLEQTLGWQILRTDEWARTRYEEEVTAWWSDATANRESSEKWADEDGRPE